MVIMRLAQVWASVFNMKSIRIFALLMVFMAGKSALAQSFAQPKKASMQYVATFEAGHPGAGIYKLYDASEDVVCYLLMPDTVSRKQVEGKQVYEANSLGSISCVKLRYGPQPVAKQSK